MSTIQQDSMSLKDRFSLTDDFIEMYGELPLWKMFNKDMVNILSKSTRHVLRSQTISYEVYVNFRHVITLNKGEMFFFFKSIRSRSYSQNSYVSRSMCEELYSALEQFLETFYKGSVAEVQIKKDKSLKEEFGVSDAMIKVFQDKPLKDLLNISGHTKYGLKIAQINTFGDLIFLTKYDLLNKDGIGKEVLAHIYRLF